MVYYKWVKLWAAVLVVSLARSTTGAAPSAAEVECGGGAAGWAVRDAGGEVCVLACLRGQATVRYRRRDGTETHAALALPAAADAVATGTCAPTAQLLNLTWLEGNASLALTWAPEHAPNVTATPPARYALQAINLTLSPAALPDAAWEEASTWAAQGDWWQVGGDASWQCAPNDTFQLHPVSNVSTLSTLSAAPSAANVTVWAVRAQAFRTSNSTQWGPGRSVQCAPGGDVSDVVPLVVGALLATLVAFVLGAYLVARRRHAHTGYLSM